MKCVTGYLFIALILVSCIKNPAGPQEENPIEDGVICYTKVDDLTNTWQIYLNGNPAFNISNNPDNDAYNPRWSPHGDAIAYRDDWGNDIYLYDIKADRAINLTHDLGMDESATPELWTPSGNRIIYRLKKSGSPDKTCIMNRDGTDKRILFDYSLNLNYAYFDSHAHLIFYRIENENDVSGSVYKSDLAGNAEKIVDKSLELGVPFGYDPDDETLLFTCEDVEINAECLVSYQVSTYSKDTLMTTETNWSIRNAFYSNDYSRIGIVLHHSKEFYYQLSILDIKSDQIHLLLDVGRKSGETLDFHKKSFSPNDRYIAYSINIQQESEWYWWISYLYIVDIQTKQTYFIDEGKEPQWNPLSSK